MIHLAATGPYAGLPYCKADDYNSFKTLTIYGACEDVKAEDPEATFAHAFCLDLTNPNICPKCLEFYNRPDGEE